MGEVTKYQRAEVPAVPRTPYDKMRALEALVPEVLEEIPIDSMTSHQWCDGVYCRRFALPADAVVVSKVHRKENWFLLFSGKVSIYDGDGNVTTLEAPHLMVTTPGTKRIVYAHSDAVMYTFHGNPDNETDVAELESRYVIPEVKPTLPPAVARALLEKHI